MKSRSSANKRIMMTIPVIRSNNRTGRGTFNVTPVPVSEVVARIRQGIGSSELPAQAPSETTRDVLDWLSWFARTRQGRRVEPFGPRWGLLLPKVATVGASSVQIREALTGLCQHRGAGDPFDFDAEKGGNAGTSELRAWMSRADVATWLGSLDCVLIAADPADIPFQLDATLNVEKLVGRLCFDVVPGDDPAAAYRIYAKKLVEAETRIFLPRTGAVLIHSAWRPDDPATFRGNERIVLPLLEYLGASPTDKDILTRGRSWLRSLVGGENDKRSAIRPATTGADTRRRALLTSTTTQELQEAISSGHPTMLVTCSHGGECSDPASICQGAPCDVNEQFFTCDDVVGMEGPVLPNGIAFLYACNSAGTPRNRSWRDWYWDQREFVEPPVDRRSALPVALLSRPDGPLAVVAHVDVVFLFGVADMEGEFLPASAAMAGSHFHRLIEGILGGVPVGAALREVVWASNRAARDLAYRRSEYVNPETENAESERDAVAHIQFLDAQGWIVLGDPLATLEGRAGRIPGQYLTRGAPDDQPTVEG